MEKKQRRSKFEVEQYGPNFDPVNFEFRRKADVAKINGQIAQLYRMIEGLVKLKTRREKEWKKSEEYRILKN